MIISPYQYLEEAYLLPESYSKIDVINSCNQAIDEGVASDTIISMASSYTFNLVAEMLDNVKEALLAIYTKLLSYFNNYILNSVNLASKYRELIIDRYKTLKKTVVFKTYEYTKLYDKNYPNLKMDMTKLETRISEFQDSVISNNLGSDDVESWVDKMLLEFGSSVLNISVDTYDLKSSVKSGTRQMIQGREVIKNLQPDDLSKFIDEICGYKKLKDSITRTKKEILSEYERLRSVYTKTMKKKEAESVGIDSIRNPEFSRFKTADSMRFANINMGMTRIFNGFITIYSESFNTKLGCLQEKIDQNRDVIVRMMSETSIFAAVNPKNPARNRAPQKIGTKLQ